MMHHFEHKKTRFKRKKLGKKEANYAIKMLILLLV